MLFLAVAILIAGIFISHKIAGRVDFKIRNTDELGKAAFALEEMVKSLHGDVRKMKETAKVLGSVSLTVTRSRHLAGIRI